MRHAGQALQWTSPAVLESENAGQSGSWKYVVGPFLRSIGAWRKIPILAARHGCRWPALSPDESL
jgi:hypothetical protein